MKKIFKTIFILVIIGAFALFLFWLINPGRAPIQNNFISKIRDFSPFGGSSSEVVDNTSNNSPDLFEEGGETIDQKDRVLPDIEMLYSSPVGGYTVRGTGASTTVRVVDRATGHIIDIDTNTRENVRVSNTTLPGIIEAIWFNEGNGVIMRYLRESSDIIETLVISNISTQGEDTSGTYLEEQVLSIKPISDTELAYTVQSGFGSDVKIYDTKQNTATLIHNSTLKEIAIVGGNKNNIFIQTKASYVSTGYLYAVSRKNSSITKVLGGNRGLTTLLSDDLTHIFATTGGESSNSFLYDQNLAATNATGARTVSSKCAFTKQNDVYCGIPTVFGDTMPDSWYMGLATFTDQLWKISPDGSRSFVTGLQNIDIIKPSFSSDENQFFFVNKKNGSVWIVRLNQLSQ